MFHNKARRISLFLAILGLSLFLDSQAHAHEFWIEPLAFHVAKTEKIRANIRVGQRFKGNAQAYIPDNFRAFSITNRANTRAVTSRVGDLPALDETPIRDGLHILSYRSTATKLVYANYPKFESFVRKHSLDWVLRQHAKRSLSTEAVVEAYWRYAKSLVSVGTGAGSDRIVGLPFEWVVETNPYLPKANGKRIRAKLYWQGKPLANAQVVVFRRAKGETSRSVLRTNSRGRVTIRQSKGGRFLINAVQMTEARSATARRTGAVWESYWASTTYELPIVP